MNIHIDSNRGEQRLLATPAEIFSTLIADMHRARRSIDMEFYIFENDNIGTTIARLLARKARQGVAVRLVVDGYGSRNIGSGICNILKNSGVDVRFTSSMGLSRNHRKMVIIDGVVAHVGGVNIADRYVVGNTLGVWYDVELRFVGDDVATLAKLFQYDYLAASGKMSEIEKIVSSSMSFHWSESQWDIATLFDDVVTRASGELIITTPYLFPTPRTLKLLREAVCRGVRVVIIIPERSDVWLLDRLMRSMYRKVVDVGAELLLLRGAFLHAKMAVADRRRVVLGSANLDARSFHINRELMLSTTRRTVCRDAYTFVNALRYRATPPTEEEMRGSFPNFIVAFVAPYL